MLAWLKAVSITFCAGCGIAVAAAVLTNYPWAVFLAFFGLMTWVVKTEVVDNDD